MWVTPFCQKSDLDACKVRDGVTRLPPLVSCIFSDKKVYPTLVKGCQNHFIVSDDYPPPGVSLDPV